MHCAACFSHQNVRVELLLIAARVRNNIKYWAFTITTPMSADDEPHKYGSSGKHEGAASDLNSAKLLGICSVDVRQGFIRKVYGILLAQLVTAAFIALFVFSNDVKGYVFQHSWMFYLALTVNIVTICALACCASNARQYPRNMIFLGPLRYRRRSSWAASPPRTTQTRCWLGLGWRQASSLDHIVCISNKVRFYRRRSVFVRSSPQLMHFYRGALLSQPRAT